MEPQVLAVHNSFHLDMADNLPPVSHLSGYWMFPLDMLSGGQFVVDSSDRLDMRLQYLNYKNR